MASSEEAEVDPVLEQSRKKPKKLDKRSFRVEEWRAPVKEKPPDTLKCIVLTDEHKHIITRTWELFLRNELSYYGVQIFKQIFILNPRMKEIFVTGQQIVDADDYTTDPDVLRHPKQFMEAVEAAVGHLDHLESFVTPVFINLGKHHIYFRGITERYFDTFSASMMLVWSQQLGPEIFDAQTRTAWSRLFDILIECLKFGLRLAIEEKNSYTTS